MSLVWDKAGDRVFESGLDKGVLYLPDGSAVPWNGLTSVIESFDSESTPVYFDGMKINDLVVLGDFSATMRAITYPDQFTELEGMVPVKRGVFYGAQKPKSFGLCYRTQIGNDLAGSEAGHKIHILYNVTAIASEKSHSTISSDTSLEEFEWNITTVPEKVPGFAPTSHIIIDTTDVDPWLLSILEDILYGTPHADASLIPMEELVARIGSWYRVHIIDNGDGTWTAEAEHDGFITINPDGTFEIVGVNAVYLDDDTFIVYDTDSIEEVPLIKVHDNGNGTWTATTQEDNLIVMTGAYSFEIRNAHVDYQDADSWRIQDTTAED